MTPTHEPTLFDVADARPLVHVDTSRDRRDLAAHHVRLEPSRGVTWVAFLADTPAIRDAGTGPHAALCRLLADGSIDPRVIPPGPGTCATCRRENPCVFDSPKGTTTFLGYCDAPCIPTPKAKR